MNQNPKKELENSLSVEEKRKKESLEKLLRKHGYRQDERPDHREWTKISTAFFLKMRLDQNNPDGWNGFLAQITTYMRWDVKPKHIRKILKFIKEEF